MALRSILCNSVVMAEDRSLLCRTKTSAHGHVKTKFLGPLNNQNLLCSSSSSLRFHISSTPRFQGLRTVDAVSSNASLSSGECEFSLHSLAQFYVNEHNAKQNGDLQFVRVVHASTERDDSRLLLIVENFDPGVGAEDDVRVHRLSDIGTYTQEEDELVRVLEAAELHVNPFIHHITFEAIDAGKPKIFKAVVRVERLSNLLNLYELKPISDASGIVEYELKPISDASGIVEYELKPISDASGIVGIKHQGHSSHEASSSNPIPPINIPYKTLHYYPSQVKSGFVTVPEAATCDEIRSFAKFAVNEHNEKENAQLEFVRVVGASQVLVSGIRYHITLEAMDGGKLKKYLAAVWVQEWKNFMKLTEWETIDGAS